MSKQTQRFDPFPFFVIGIFALLGLGIWFFMIPAQLESAKEYQIREDYIINSDCDQLKEIVIEYLEDYSSSPYSQNQINKAKGLHEWKCEK